MAEEQIREQLGAMAVEQETPAEPEQPVETPTEATQEPEPGQPAGTPAEAKPIRVWKRHGKEYPMTKWEEIDKFGQIGLDAEIKRTEIRKAREEFEAEREAFYQEREEWVRSQPATQPGQPPQTPAPTYDPDDPLSMINYSVSKVEELAKLVQEDRAAREDRVSRERVEAAGREVDTAFAEHEIFKDETMCQWGLEEAQRLNKDRRYRSMSVAELVAKAAENVQERLEHIQNLQGKKILDAKAAQDAAVVPSPSGGIAPPTTGEKPPTDAAEYREWLKQKLNVPE